MITVSFRNINLIQLVYHFRLYPIPTPGYIPAKAGINRSKPLYTWGICQSIPHQANLYPHVKTYTSWI